MKIYLDSCILISYFSTHKEEKEKKKIINNVLGILSNVNNIEIFTSKWAIAEMMNIMLSRQNQKNSFVLECESELLNKRRLGKLKIKIIDPGLKKGYDFSELFYDLRGLILKYHSGVGDTIHATIMKNNRIKTILTFDEEDFGKIRNITVWNPNGIKIVEEKLKKAGFKEGDELEAVVEKKGR